jgi:hypothetical protein
MYTIHVATEGNIGKLGHQWFPMVGKKHMQR